MAVLCAVSVLLSCKDNEADVPFEQLHECTNYEPTTAEGDLSGIWDDPLDQDEFDFTIPNDPGGGYVEIVHTSPAPIVPTMFTNISPPISGTITGGSAAQGANEQVRHDVFEVSSGQSYHVLVGQFFKAKSEDYPLNYSGSWTFNSRVDCYEPNNIFEEAKAIPLNQVIEAYGIAGYQDYFLRTGDPHTHDWYKFTLNTAQEIEITFLQVATNQQVNLRLLNGSQQVNFSVSEPEGGLLVKNAGCT